MRTLLNAGLMLAALVAAACAPVQEVRTRPVPSPEANLANGLHIAESHCAGCHAIGVTGESHNPAAPPFRTLSRNYQVNALEEALAEGILVGHPEMPEFRFSPQEIDDLIAYLQSVQERRGG